MRPAICLLLLVFSALGLAGDEKAVPPATGWKRLKLVSFKDFDDIVVKMDGKERKVFLIGLRPIRQAEANKERQEGIRKEVLAELEKAELFGKVAIEKGEKSGLSIDAFSHRKHGFKHGWDPQKYPWCAMGWGAYNFNLYFVHRKLSTYEENFGDSRYWKDLFAKVLQEKSKEK